MEKRLACLLEETTVLDLDLNGRPAEMAIGQVVYDSRKVQPGDLFVAVPGFQHDGHEFIAEAVAKGAAAVVLERSTMELPIGVAKVVVPSSRLALPNLASAFYGYPSRKMKIVGVTGTNGKTSTTFLCDAIFQLAGFVTGLVGTIENRVGGKVFPGERTTPESVDIEELLWKMVNDKVTHVSLEVSSHALDLGRVKNIEFDVAVFTNLSQDHLDYHKNLTEYRLAKAKLFSQLDLAAAIKSPKTAVLNADDESSSVMKAATSAPILTIGIDNKADISASQIQIGDQNAVFQLKTPTGTRKVRLHTTGLFSVYNALTACAVGLSQSLDLDLIVTALENMPGIPGRFEQVRCGQQFTVIVDYAHTPAGLENILKTAQRFARGRVILVFGCGGDRDRTKRPLMGQLAVRYADLVFITSDNPRTEDPAIIIDQIEEGIKKLPGNHRAYTRYIDRREAIYAALAEAQTDDVVLIAGKGHETDQVLADKVIHLDDREVVRTYFKELN
ncbi:MAG TPA: UDP-N-acetylmuramoyl-L-alanyl-D-glutamate--2,6-diaminopimelate ligase [bacterium]|nr:UDP-N-acetylmuramoyl-L-alanyl-D-glutamate--2,6-diaminopimelate ligase [bacterium]